ncbi:MAG: hypothetical protein ACI9LM_004279, partial [Alteromonadaceae bacterium]
RSNITTQGMLLWLLFKHRDHLFMLQVSPANGSYVPLIQLETPISLSSSFAI